MEQLLLNSTNVANSGKPINAGDVDLLQLIRDAAEKYHDNDLVMGVEDLPEGALYLHWAEFYTPRDVVETALRMGKQICGGRLLDYKFQLLGGFTYNGEPVQGYDWHAAEDHDKYETFDARLSGKRVHSTALKGNGACNCSWLLEFLLRTDRAVNDPDFKCTLRWRKTFDGYQLSLIAASNDRRTLEAHNFVFSSDFKYMKWEQHYALGEVSFA